MSEWSIHILSNGFNANFSNWIKCSNDMHDSTARLHIFTHHRSFFSASNIEAVKLHSKRILYVVHLAHCIRCCIEISFPPLAGIRPSVLAIFHIPDCIQATYMSNTCNNFVVFSLSAVFDCDCDSDCPVLVMAVNRRLEYLVASHIDYSPNKSVH